MPDEVMPELGGAAGPGPDENARGASESVRAAPSDVEPRGGSALALPRNLLVAGVLAIFALLFSCNKLPAERRDVGLTGFPARIEGAERVRILIRTYDRVSSASLSVDGPFEVLTASRPGAPLVKQRGTYSLPARSNVAVSRGCVKVGPRHWAPVVWLLPERRDAVRVGRTELPYGVCFFARDRSAMTVSMVLNVEEYLCGVVDAEVPVELWHDEALKALAVAARTFALYEILTRQDEPWDVQPTVMSMAYRPGGRRNVLVNRAVNATRGVVMTWNGRVFPAKFCSSCGGHTEDARGVFYRSEVPPLSAVPCRYCDIKQNPLRQWSFHVSEGRVRDVVQRLVRGSKMNVGVGRIEGIEVLRRGEGRRAVQLRIDHAYEPPLVVQANEFRLALGAGRKELCSTLLQTDPEGQIPKIRGGFLFKGSGWGHGVGMCQYGSQGMGLQGYAYHDILRHYYTGIELHRLDYAEEPAESDEANAGPAAGAGPRSD